MTDELQNCRTWDPHPNINYWCLLGNTISLETFNQHRITDINQCREENQHRINEINNLFNQVNELKTQNQNQAESLVTQTNFLNQQAISMAIVKEKNTQLTHDFSNLKHILCAHIDCNIEVIGAVEPGTDGLNLVHN